nr:FAD binding domain-containing protein [Aliiroseovarius subalbicans]
MPNRLERPLSVAAAIAALSGKTNKVVPVAGATWIMRAGSRGEKIDGTFVDLSAIPDLSDIDVAKDKVSIGAMATQDVIAKGLAGHADMAALMMATGYTANPAIRRAATIGGNICTADFAASDIVPALLALDAEVEIVSPDGTSLMSMAEFLSTRRSLGRAVLVTRIVIPRRLQASTHSRITLRKAGDYPVANLSAAITVAEDRTIRTAAVAVGGVEPVAKRWTGFENALIGRNLESGEFREIAGNYTDEFEGRDDTGAPGWYRVRLLPALADRAFRFLTKSTA